MSKKVFIGVGHGGSDPGAVGYVTEKDINLKMAAACGEYLVKRGVKVHYSRTKDENDTITEEIVECAEFDPDLAIDIHNNSGKGEGFEVYHSYLEGTGKKLAENIESEILLIGQKSRGCKIRKNSNGSDYYGFIRCTNCPAVIVEGVFVDHKADAAKADTDAECKRFGEAYAKGILKTLGLEDSNSIASTEHLYKVQVGAYKDRANAEKMLAVLESKGITGFIKKE